MPLGAIPVGIKADETQYAGKKIHCSDVAGQQFAYKRGQSLWFPKVDKAVHNLHGKAAAPG